MLWADGLDYEINFCIVLLIHCYFDATIVCGGLVFGSSSVCPL